MIDIRPLRMRSMAGCLALVLGGSLLIAGCASNEPRPNLTLLKWSCIRWHDSGDYGRAVERAATPALASLKRQLRNPPPGAAVVFDIDETLLSNWPYLRATGFHLEMDTFGEWTRREQGIPLEPTKAIFETAREAGLPIFLISGRPESFRKATIRDLESAGYHGWTEIFLKPDGYKDVSIIPFKSGVRRMLTGRGHTIILNVGDQWSDLKGGYARHHFKLPNPFYYLP